MNQDLVVKPPWKDLHKFSRVKNDRYEYLAVFNFLDYSEGKIFKSQLFFPMLSSPKMSMLDINYYWCRSTFYKTSLVLCSPDLMQNQAKQLFDI